MAYLRLPDPTVSDPGTQDYLNQLVKTLRTNLQSLFNGAVFTQSLVGTSQVFNNNIPWIVGTGTPEGVVAAPVGSLYVDNGGAQDTTLWCKEVGIGDTGWFLLASTSYVDASIAVLVAEINTINSEITTINSEISTINSEISTINSEITTLNTEVSGLLNANKHTLGFSSTSPSVGQQGSYIVIPAAATLTGWSIAVDTGTATVQVWKIASGTAVPTAGNSINIAGVSISSNTAIISTDLSDFTTTAIAKDDIFAFNLSAMSAVTKLDFQLFVTTS